MSIKKYDILAVPKPRMTRSDKWKKRPETARYWAFKDEVRLKKVSVPEGGAHITFVMPMTKGWSNKKKAEMNGKPHQMKPDWDNLAKALFDAIYEDDAHIHDVRVSKIWGEKGEIWIKED